MRRLLDDRRFCPPRDGLGSMPSCDGRFVAFGAQVNGLLFCLFHFLIIELIVYAIIYTVLLSMM